jgi:hypothetical protein
MAKPPKIPSRAAGLKEEEPQILSPAIPAEIEAILGVPPLLPGSDRTVYDALISKVSQALRPQDAMEWLFVQDIVSASLNIQSLRTARTEILNDGRQEALIQSLIESEMRDGQSHQKALETAQKTATGFAGNPAGFLTSMEQHLAGMGVSLSTMEARGLVNRLGQIQAIDRMTGIELSRREAARREADSWRNGFGRRLRAETDAILDIDPTTGAA